MALLKHTITFGWPHTVQELPKELQAYWTFREEMTVEDGLILKATRIVIPPTMRESVLQQLHDGNLGFTKCYNCAKQTVYWPNLRKELEDLVLNCQLCLKHSTTKCKPKPTPSFGLLFPGQNLQVTFFTSRMIAIFLLWTSHQDSLLFAS